MIVMVINCSNSGLTDSITNREDGMETLDSINASFARQAGDFGIDCEFFQCGSEGELVTAVQNAWGHADGVILNAGDYAYYSIAIRDAIASINKPVVEVNPANLHADKDACHVSVLSAVCKGVISGFGSDGYFLALHALAAEFGAKAGR